ncbi:GntR family transcriptional regulator [Nocardioides zeae]|uniref:GntR family transcriptional regulator n=1 Tax=Nocardioides imazamoxiresistens TaxID=3231893 RepID=A0ABU3PWN7_9ACTN|nr:GntR family transcriptional regulator [Nocardioides zeae]MDT9593648.1 GntR family transcriptional regulator [Nocardioides zeae]
MSTTGARRPDAVQLTYQRLSDRIASGDVQPGSRLKESALAEELGVSRTPVREALRRLAADGLVEVHPNRGAQVVAYTPAEVADMFTVRVTLEPQATALAVPRFDAAGLDEIEDLAEQMTRLVDDGRDLQRLGELNRRFHECFLVACGNKALAAAVTAVVRPAVVHRTFHRYSGEALERSMSHHRELVVAARAGDAEWASSVMRTHVLAARHTATVRPSAP